MKVISGTPVSSGIAIGAAYLLEKEELRIPEYSIEDTRREEMRIKQAITIGKREVNSLIKALSKNKCTEECEILEAHISIMEDPELLDLTLSFINNEHKNAEYCLNKASEHYASMIEAIDDDYMKARANDVREISGLIISRLLGTDKAVSHKLKTPSLIVADTITVNEIARLNKDLVLGFITENGGITDHAAILARSYRIPFVTGLRGVLAEINGTDELMIDGNKGKVIINPDSVERSGCIAQRDKWNDFYTAALNKASESTFTSDGRRIKVYANISEKNFIPDAVKQGAEGVGLLRTEFLFLGSSDIPDEDAQCHIYSSICDSFGGREIIVRTLDIGSDKKNTKLNLTDEENPALGLRGLRLCFQKETELFKPQIKAILRSSFKRNIKLMLPMVTSVEEVRKFKALLEVCKAELKDKCMEYNPDISIGIMIEVPSAAILADAFTDEVDFFSIGTNDLTQYTLAIDRTNSAVSYLNEGLHPAVLELINKTIKSAHKKNKTVAICGELAGDPKAIPVLIGIGVDELSVNPSSIPVVKEIIRNIEYAEAKKISQKVLKTYDKNKITSLTSGLIPEILK